MSLSGKIMEEFGSLLGIVFFLFRWAFIIAAVSIATWILWYSISSIRDSIKEKKMNKRYDEYLKNMKEKKQ